MTSLILQVTVRVLQPLFMLVGVVMLLRGHDLPGGGFIGGLLAAAGFALASQARGPGRVRRQLGGSPRYYGAAGLTLVLVSAVLPLFQGKPLLTGLSHEVRLGWLTIGLRTPMLFDLGEFLTVFGAVLAIILLLSEEE